MQILQGLFGRFLLCCVWIGLDWIQFLGHQLDWTRLGLMNRGLGLDWILATQSIPYSGRFRFQWAVFEGSSAVGSSGVRNSLACLKC